MTGAKYTTTDKYSVWDCAGTMKVTQTLSRPRTSFTIDDLMSRKDNRCARSRSRSPTCSPTTSPRSSNGSPVRDYRRDMTSSPRLRPHPTTEQDSFDLQHSKAKLDFFKRRLEGLAASHDVTDASAKTHVHPLLHGHHLNSLRGRPDLLLRPGFPPDLALLQTAAALQNQHHLQHQNVTSQQSLFLPQAPAAGLLASPNGLMHPAGPMHGAPLPPMAHNGHPLTNHKDLFNLYQLHMHGAPPFMGRFPGKLVWRHSIYMYIVSLLSVDIYVFIIDGACNNTTMMLTSLVRGPRDDTYPLNKL